MENILEIIQEHSLTVRCLPLEIVSYWKYKEGDENRKYIDSKGNPINSKREVVVKHCDLEYFQKTKPSKFTSATPEERLAKWKERYPNGEKLLKETRVLEKGGWWIVKQTKCSDSHVIFDMKKDFAAPTLEEAIDLFLKSIA